MILDPTRRLCGTTGGDRQHGGELLGINPSRHEAFDYSFGYPLLIDHCLAAVVVTMTPASVWTCKVVLPPLTITQFAWA
jgi:hypothetical protein